MGKHGYIGESKSDAAINKMDKFIAKSDRDKARRGDTGQQKDTFISQLKKIYPRSWQEELDEIRREGQYPEYLEEKRAVHDAIVREWNNRPRIIREEGQSLISAIERGMNDWLKIHRPLYPVKLGSSGSSGRGGTWSSSGRGGTWGSSGRSE